jgi:hypothetical protein
VEECVAMRLCKGPYFHDVSPKGEKISVDCALISYFPSLPIVTPPLVDPGQGEDFHEVAAESGDATKESKKRAPGGQ